MPGAAEVHVWWAHNDDLTDAHLGLLDPAERERWVRATAIKRPTGDRW